MTDLITGAALAAKIEKIVTLHPNLHDQTSWFENYSYDKDRFVDAEIMQLDLLLTEDEELEEEVDCGATLCAAGWACVLNGYTLKNVEDNPYADKQVAVKDGQEYDIQTLATDLLELSPMDASALFLDTNNDEAIEALSAIANNEELDWEEIFSSRNSSYDEDDWGYPEDDGYDWDDYND